MAAATPPPLPADLEAGLKRLKLRAFRQHAPEVLAAAKTQRWAPDELLRALVEAELAARDAASLANRTRAAAFPVAKTLDEFQLSASSIPKATYDYLAALEWIDAAENLCLIGPPGTGKSHLLIALGHAAITRGHRVRYLTAAEAVERLYAALADNSVGKTIDTLPRHQLLIIDELGFAPPRPHRLPTALPAHRRRLRTPCHRARQPPPLRGLGPLPPRPHHRHRPPRPPTAPRRRRHHRRRVLPHERSQKPHRHEKGALTPRKAGTFAGHQRGLQPGH